MPFRAVLDADVLFPFSLRDTLLRLAEPEPVPGPASLYVPLWSERILEEMVRNLVEDRRMDQERANRLASLMRSAFEDASVGNEAIRALEESMTNDPGDRHVLAAAVAGGAEAIITFNLEHSRRRRASRSGSRPPIRMSFSSRSTELRRGSSSRRCVSRPLISRIRRGASKTCSARSSARVLSASLAGCAPVSLRRPMTREGRSPATE
jgi:predicted nucleic acid-binding protein